MKVCGSIISGNLPFLGHWSSGKLGIFKGGICLSSISGTLVISGKVVLYNQVVSQACSIHKNSLFAIPLAIVELYCIYKIGLEFTWTGHVICFITCWPIFHNVLCLLGCRRIDDKLFFHPSIYKGYC